MRVGLAQFDIAWEDKSENRKRITRLVESSQVIGSIEWLIFPEMSLTGFSMDPEKTTLSGDDEEFFRDLARHHRFAVTYGGVRGGRNRSVTLAADGSTLADYAKMHLFSFANEHHSYQPGEIPVTTAMGGFQCSPAICYDLRFSYLFWNRAITTDVFFVIANWPEKRAMHWETLLRARAIENQCFVIGVNRVGKDPRNSYSGSSAVIDPLGNYLLDCRAESGIFSVDLQPSQVRQARADFPFLPDRKAETR